MFDSPLINFVLKEDENSAILDCIDDLKALANVFGSVPQQQVKTIEDVDAIIDDDNNSKKNAHYNLSTKLPFKCMQTASFYF